MTRFIEVYCALDYHSAIAEDHFYEVNSLYFDTRSFEFLQQRQDGKDGRFNMRVRSYGDDADRPYFLEIKRKSGTTGKKYRATASAAEWPAILQDPGYRIPADDEAKNRVNKELFLRLATSYAIEPKLLTRYRRRAFISQVDDYARVTMDIGLKYRHQDGFDMSADHGMIGYDNQTIYARDMLVDANVILELKSNIGQVPVWMLDLIATFELKQQGFSKYLQSALADRVENGDQYMNRDRKPMYGQPG